MFTYSLITALISRNENITIRSAKMIIVFYSQLKWVLFFFGERFDNKLQMIYYNLLILVFHRIERHGSVLTYSEKNNKT